MKLQGYLAFHEANVSHQEHNSMRTEIEHRSLEVSEMMRTQRALAYRWNQEHYGQNSTNS